MTDLQPTVAEAGAFLGEPASPDLDEMLRNLVRHAAIGSTAEASSPVRQLIKDWLGTDPVELPGYSDSYWHLMQPNLQAAIDAFLAEPGRESRIVGMHAPSATFWEEVPFSRLLSAPSFKWGGASAGLVDYQMRPIGVDEYMRCLDRALILFRDADGAGAMWLIAQGGYSPTAPDGRPVNLEVLTTPADRAPAVLAELRASSEKLSPYRGKMFRIRMGPQGAEPDFMERRAPMTADDLILPDGVLDRINEHTVAVSRSRDTLRALGMHLKRGILLHGPPGTGKTHTIRYLASQMPESTVVILPKQAIKAATVLLPIFEPALIVLDDVDIVAETRSMPGMTDRRILFEVLEVLDGLIDQADVLFVLTTNRAETLEPAIAARPGRVDQTIEIARPDDGCRRRLFDLYRKGVDLRIDDADVETVLDRTQGVTASFFKELLRRATVEAVRRGEPIDAENRVPVTAEVLFVCLDRMLDPANPMTRLLLGAEPDHAVPAVRVEEA